MKQKEIKGRRSPAGRTAIFKTASELRHFLGDFGNKNVGFVPTMGALHHGHISLVEGARQECDLVVLSIFVNPLQFGPGEDFEKYPRRLDNDINLATDAGVDVVFAPTNKDLFPETNLTKINVGGLDKVLCGKHRPGHFAGVATIVVKLFNIIRPQRAYFGMKDWQQLIIIKKVVKDLSIDVEIIAMPTIREADGLAASSRNRYLSPKERQAALALPASLKVAADMIAQGEFQAERIKTEAKNLLASTPGIKLEYFSICHSDNLKELSLISGDMLIAAAVRVGQTRLIDNMVIKV